VGQWPVAVVVERDKLADAQATRGQVGQQFVFGEHV
jgi:hypothetical protein